MLKKLLEFLLSDKKSVEETDLKDIEALIKHLQEAKGRKLEFLNFKKVDFKEVKNEDGTLRITAIASTEDLDHGNDIVKVGGIKVLSEKLIMLLQHDSDKIIGAWDNWYIKDNKFYVEGTFIQPISDWQKEAFELVKQGILNSVSIGYYVDKVSFDGDIRILEEIELVEVSVVANPMNPNAKIVSVEEKSAVNPSVKTDQGEGEAPTEPPVISPDPNNANPPVEDKPPVVNEEVVKITAENDKLKARISELESEVADYEAVMDEAEKEIEALLKSKGVKDD